jgi:hypothetical protein
MYTDAIKLDPVESKRINVPNPALDVASPTTESWPPASTATELGPERKSSNDAYTNRPPESIFIAKPLFPDEGSPLVRKAPAVTGKFAVGTPPKYIFPAGSAASAFIVPVLRIEV